MPDAAAATRAISARAAALDPAIATTAFIKDDREGKVFVDPTRVGGATVIAAYSPRVRPGVPVSFPVGWDDLDAVTPADFTIHTAVERLGGDDPWAGAHARAAGGSRGDHRGRAHDARPARGRDARGQAPGPRPARA